MYKISDMNPILEESALPTTTSNPDVEPTYVLGTPLSKRLDRMEYEYDDEQSVDGVWEDGRSLRSQSSRDGKQTPLGGVIAVAFRRSEPS